LALYFNRIANLDADPSEITSAISAMIETEGAAAKNVAASFKNVAQVDEALLAGAHAVDSATRPTSRGVRSGGHRQGGQRLAKDWRHDLDDTSTAALSGRYSQPQ
jgi:hypothetical protein